MTYRDLVVLSAVNTHTHTHTHQQTHTHTHTRLQTHTHTHTDTIPSDVPIPAEVAFAISTYGIRSRNVIQEAESASIFCLINQGQPTRAKSINKQHTHVWITPPHSLQYGRLLH